MMIDATQLLIKTSRCLYRAFGHHFRVWFFIGQVMSKHFIYVKSCHSCQIMSYHVIHVIHVIHVAVHGIIHVHWASKVSQEALSIKLGGWVRKGGQKGLSRPSADSLAVSRRQKCELFRYLVLSKLALLISSQFIGILQSCLPKALKSLFDTPTRLN
jgi:hypothetical protein